MVGRARDASAKILTVGQQQNNDEIAKMADLHLASLQSMNRIRPQTLCLCSDWIFGFGI
jgi:hypothetical protein